jgi:hypothetical protein
LSIGTLSLYRSSNGAPNRREWRVLVEDHLIATDFDAEPLP